MWKQLFCYQELIVCHSYCLLVLSWLVYWCNLLKQLGRIVVSWLQHYSEEYRFQVNTVISFLLTKHNICKGYQTFMTYWCSTTTSCILMSLLCRDVHQDGFKPQSVNQKLYSILISGQALFLQISWQIAWVNTLVPQGTEKDNVESISEMQYWWENIESMHTATHNGLGSQAATAAWLSVWNRGTCHFSISRTSEPFPPLLTFPPSICYPTDYR